MPAPRVRYIFYMKHIRVYMDLLRPIPINFIQPSTLGFFHAAVRFKFGTRFRAGKHAKWKSDTALLGDLFPRIFYSVWKFPDPTGICRNERWFLMVPPRCERTMVFAEIDRVPRNFKVILYRFYFETSIKLYLVPFCSWFTQFHVNNIKWKAISLQNKKYI